MSDAGADVAGADVAGADVAGADVAGADVAGADIAGTGTLAVGIDETGQIVVARMIVSVVTFPIRAGQSVIVAAQEVTV